MIISAKVKRVQVTQKGGKDESDPVLKHGVVTLEVEDAEDWALDMLTAMMDGREHQIDVRS